MSRVEVKARKRVFSSSTGEMQLWIWSLAWQDKSVVLQRAVEGNTGIYPLPEPLT